MTPIESLTDTLPPLELPQILVQAPEGRSALPLAAQHLRTEVVAGVAELSLTQRFHNPYSVPLEAVYVFPLPGAAAVHRLELCFGEQRLVADLQERGQARAAYAEALERGQQAALLEQERDDIFTLSLGNLPPGLAVEVQLGASLKLDYREAGLYELRLPLVVAPRYLPGDPLETRSGSGVEADTDLVPDASRLSPPRLAPGFDPQVDLSVEVVLHTGSQGLRQLACTQHLTEMVLEDGRVQLSLAREGERLNRDFVLRWRTGEAALQTRLCYAPGPEGQGYGLLELSAPAGAGLLPRDVVFLLDRSGSMGDHKMLSAAQACGLLLDSLGPEDRYAVLAFDDQMQWLDPDWRPASEQARQQTHGALRQLQSRGGTELFVALEQALDRLATRTAGQGRLAVIVLVTDGQVGDESRILRSLQTRLGDSLVYSVGVDTAVNASFLERLAHLGGGTAVSVSPGEALNRALQGIAAEIGAPALRELVLNVPELAPEHLPNLYLGRSLSVYFRGPRPEQPVLHASSESGPLELPLTLETVDMPALARLWAKARLQSLEDRFRLASGGERDALRSEMIALSLEHRVLCRLTAWLAVAPRDHSLSEKETAQRLQVVQPVEMPDLWEESGYLGGVAAPAPMMAAPMPAPPPRRMSSRSANFLMMGSHHALSEAAAEGPPAEAQEQQVSPAAKSAPSRQQVPQAAPGGGGLLSQIFKKRAKAESSKGVLSGPPRTPAPAFGMRQESAPEGRSVQGEGLSSGLPASLRQRLYNWLDRLAQLLNGGDPASPEAEVLLSERQTLLSELGHAPGAELLPQLQALLRQDALRLLLGWSQGVPETLRQRCLQRLSQAEAELGTPEQAPAAVPVWEQTV
ncbi:MAG: VIT domain-containing protein [Candidatus Sericytochromatia bacterium]